MKKKIIFYPPFDHCALVLLSTWSPNSLLRSRRCVVEKGVSGPMLVYTELKEYVHNEAVKSASV